MGRFDTHGGTFAPQGYMKVETGGTHEENPNGGVQVGVDPNGVPNMLEENEPVYQDFVYSNQIAAEADVLKEFNIPEKYAGKHYSDIADEYVDDNRPNDPIANNGMNAMLVRLANAQEEQKRRKEQKEIEDELAGMSPEEIAELENYIAQMEQGNAPQEQVVQPQMFGQGGDKDTLYISTPNMDRFGNIIIKGEPILLPGTAGASTVSSGAKLSQRGLQALEGAKKRAKAFEWLKKLPFMTSKEEAARLYASGPKVVSSAKSAAPVAENIAEQTAPVITKAADATKNTGAGRTVGKALLGITGAIAVGDIINKKTNFIGKTKDALTYDPYKVMNNENTPSDSVDYDWENVDVSGWATNVKSKGGPAPTWPRYAGAATAGLVGLYDAFQKPDTYNVPRVSPNLATTRLRTINPTYNPIDSNAAVNDVLSSSAGTVRGLRNSGLGPSTGAAILAADYNAGRNIGAAKTEAVGYNNNLLNNIVSQINANRQAEAQVGLNREQMNNNLLYDAAVRNAQGLLQQQQLNYGAEGQKYAAIQNQIDQVAQALSGIGNENFAMNMVNSGLYDYEILPNGDVRFIKRDQTQNSGKCGGLMKTYKK